MLQLPSVVAVLLLAVLDVSMCVASDNSSYCDALPDAPNPPPHPEVVMQYTANMEIIATAPSVPGEDWTRVEMYVKEVYDEPGNILAMEIRSRVDVMKYILDWNTKQMVEIRISKQGQSIRECVQKPLSDGVVFFPPIWGSNQNLSVSHIIGPGVLLGIMNWTEAQYKGKYVVRGMTADRWDWCGLTELEDYEATHNVSMATYWSDRIWKMAVSPSEAASLPLSWEVEVRKPFSEGVPVTDVEENLVHNILSFRPGFVDHTAFLIPPDVYCRGLLPDEHHPFPDFVMDRLFVFSMEMKETIVKAFTWADAWYDFEKQLYRTDHDVNFNSNNSVPTTHIFDFTEGIAYTFPMEAAGYTISIINDTLTDWVDITGINHLWADSPSAFFGTDVTNYTYYGKWSERHIKGEEWRGVRTDWPSHADVSGGIPETLWQWTFSNKNVTYVTSLGEQLYLERNVPIGLRVTAMNDISNGATISLPKGCSYSYQIYDFDVETDSRSRDLFADGGVFDVSRCYSPNVKQHLRFKLDISSWPGVVDTPLLTAGIFNEYWQKTLASFGQVSFIRITRVKTIKEDIGEIWIEFTLLDRHPRIGMLSPDIFESMTTGEAAKRFVEEAINAGNVKFEGENYDGEHFALVAESGSLTTVIKPTCTTTTAGSIITYSVTNTPSTSPQTKVATPSTSTRPGSTNEATSEKTTVRPSSASEKSTTVITTTSDISNTTLSPPFPPNTERYSVGALLGLGFGMLAVGLAAGAGATYFAVISRG